MTDEQQIAALREEIRWAEEATRGRGGRPGLALP